MNGKLIKIICTKSATEVGTSKINQTALRTYKHSTKHLYFLFFIAGHWYLILEIVKIIIGTKFNSTKRGWLYFMD